jgi:hypothetical protein
VPLFAVTIFCGAFLLFLVQPLMGKFLLPWFGGGPGVWTTCLLFFQAFLLGGYAYAHLLQRLRPRTQALVHGALLVVSLIFLPVVPSSGWQPTGSEDPVSQILLLLTVTLGVPYLVLAATGPLLQRWFSLAHPGRPPYRLYALSNAGSLLALVAFPFWFEPQFTRTAIATGWSVGLGAFALLCGACAWRLRRLDETAGAPVEAPATPAVAPTSDRDSYRPAPLATRLLWLGLPAVSSVLLAATTNKLCLSIASFPFLWVLPLAIYLVTFIVCFDHPRWYARGPFIAALAAGTGLLAWFLPLEAPPLFQQIGAPTGILLLGCMVCHGELFRLRPAADDLTDYYLAIAAGGVLGTLFVVFGAPLLFTDFRELQVGVVALVGLLLAIAVVERSVVVPRAIAAGVLALVVVLPALRADGGEHWYNWFGSLAREQWALLRNYGWGLIAALVVAALTLRQGWRLATTWRPRMAALPLLLAALLGTIFVRQAHDARPSISAGRNFYGAHRVDLYEDATNPNEHIRVLVHGGITHGLQFRQAPHSRWPTTYYGESSGIGRIFQILPHPWRVGAVGLGIGSIVTYGTPEDTFYFYEIDPAIWDVALRDFSYLKDASATVELVLGDARLVMEEELRDGKPRKFDVLVLDAFAGDAIPTHLLTREAMAVYLQHLRPGGVLAFHISNRHVQLRPVIAGLAREHGLHYRVLTDFQDETQWWLYSTEWVVATTDAALLEQPKIRESVLILPEGQREILWTDDHASLFDVLAEGGSSNFER